MAASVGLFVRGRLTRGGCYSLGSGAGSRRRGRRSRRQPYPARTRDPRPAAAALPVAFRRRASRQWPKNKRQRAEAHQDQVEDRQDVGADDARVRTAAPLRQASAPLEPVGASWSLRPVTTSISVGESESTALDVRVRVHARRHRLSRSCGAIDSRAVRRARSAGSDRKHPAGDAGGRAGEGSLGAGEPTSSRRRLSRVRRHGGGRARRRRRRRQRPTWPARRFPFRVPACLASVCS
jgi:hypothetical protein